MAASSSAETFERRREALRQRLGSGLVLVPGHVQLWRNADNPYPFRQSSHLLYLAPIGRPGAALVLDVDAGTDALFAAPDHPDDLVWHGPQPSIQDEARAIGIARAQDIEDLPTLLRTALGEGRRLHIPPLFIPQLRQRVAAWLDRPMDSLDGFVSSELVQALGDLRLHKSNDEIQQIEEALGVTAQMFDAAFDAAAPGVREAEVLAEMARVVRGHDLGFSFEPIVSVRGEVLHNDSYANTLASGDLLLIDAGVETSAGYASDITRTLPVSGAFSESQREVYDVVLAAHEAAIGALRHGIRFREVHDLASRTIASGLTEIGLMRGDPDEAVAAGAHAMFFVHGLGHPLGLDVHDLHDLGDAVAYTPEAPRSDAFGTRFLRFGRELEEGMVMTIEPGVYFIPALIDQWRAERRHSAFINYDALEGFRGFGGIRIEDDVLVTKSGAMELGPGIPRAPDAVEMRLNRA